MRSIGSLMSMKDRVALITGGAGQIGMTASETLLELGASVVLADIDGVKCERLSNELRHQNNAGVDWIAVDLADETAARACVREILARHGRLDVLVHSAAFVGTTVYPGWAAPFESQTVAAWDAAIRVNLTAAFVLVQESMEALRASGNGSVVLLSSIYGSVGPDNSLYEGTAMCHPIAYGASKGGLVQLARYLATTLAPSIRVNALSPGGVENGQPDVFRERYAKRTPLRRMANLEDLKGAIAYLASDLSSYVTGQNLHVDGGWTTW